LTNVKVMTARISSVTNACKGCTATDILLAAAGGQMEEVLPILTLAILSAEYHMEIVLKMDLANRVLL